MLFKKDKSKYYVGNELHLHLDTKRNDKSNLTEGGTIGNLLISVYFFNIRKCDKNIYFVW